MARFEHENKVRRKELKPEKKWNPPLFGIRNPVPGIPNPQHGIQNPRLSWIPLHGATCGLCLNLFCNKDFEINKVDVVVVVVYQNSSLPTNLKPQRKLLLIDMADFSLRRN